MLLEVVLAKMDSEKRARLINCAMKEFGKNGFKKASTNTIVKESGISKGLLYHYFSSKKTLYDTLRNFTLKLLSEAIQNGVNWESGDPIKRLDEITIIKLNVFKKFPHMLSFSKTMYEGLSLEDVKAMIEKYNPNIYKKVYEYNIDYTLFKEGVDIGKAMKFLQYFLDKYAEDTLLQLHQTGAEINVSEIEKDLNQYLEMYRKAFYKDS